MTTTAAMKSRTLGDILKQSDTIGTLPHVAFRVIQVVSDDNASAADLKNVLEGDAPLSARILRSVNSSAYGLRAKVTNLQLAITYLGCKQVRNLAIATSVHDSFKSGAPFGSFNRSELWKHVLSVGLCARLLAMRLRLPNFEDAFLAGLLHDIGIILEDQLCHDGFVQVIEQVNEAVTLAEVERTILGFDHMTIGDRFGAAWKLPEVIRASIRHHHDSSAYRGSEAKIVQCVEVANMLCTIRGMTSIGVNALTPSRDAIRELQLTKDDLLILAADTDQELEQHLQLFAV